MKETSAPSKQNEVPEVISTPTSIAWLGLSILLFVLIFLPILT